MKVCQLKEWLENVEDQNLQVVITNYDFDVYIPVKLNQLCTAQGYFYKDDGNVYKKDQKYGKQKLTTFISLNEAL